MKRLTSDKKTKEMTMTELAHNCMHVRGRYAWYRNYDKDMNLFDFIRVFNEAEKSSDLPADDEVLAEILTDNLQYDIDNPAGRVALVYCIMWAMADLREVLKGYEDTGVTPEQIYEIDRLYTEKCCELAVLSEKFRVLSVNYNEMLESTEKSNSVWIPVDVLLPEEKINPITNDAYVYPVTVNIGGITDVRYYSFYNGHWYNQGPQPVDNLVTAWAPRMTPYEPQV